MEIVKLIFWFVIIGVASSILLITSWFLFSLAVAFYKVYCKKNSSDPDLYNGKLD
jgi:hypothetical protein